MKLLTVVYAAILIVSCSATGIAKSGQENPDTEVFFPRGFGITVNQVGYMQGSSLDHKDGPWRAGIRRNFDVRDYKPIAAIGEGAGVRLVSLFALAEMDRLNIVATLPHARQEGHDFDNHENIGPEQIEIMDFVKNNAAHIELGVTGVGHEWWEDGKKVRSEWYDVENSESRDEEMMRRHLDVMVNILGQYGISEENGHSFPESFSAYGYYWNPDGEYSTGGLFSEYGARYASTRFGGIQELNPPDENHGGIDQGSLVLHRGVFGNFWHRYHDLPSDTISVYESDIIDGHWANFLAPDDFLQPDVNQDFIDHFLKVQRYPYRYVAKNTEQLYSQWLYQEYTRVSFDGTGAAIIDNTGMPDKVYGHQLLGNMVLSVPLIDGEHIAEAYLDGDPVPAIFEEEGYGFIYLPILEQESYTITWKKGDVPMANTVNNTGTYNVYESDVSSDDRKMFKVRMYGKQDVRFRVEEGYSASSDLEELRVIDQEYDRENGELVVTLDAHDIQGETGIITLNRR